MPLLRIQRYKASAVPGVVDSFVTGPSYDANNEDVVLELDPALFPSTGEYAVFVATLGPIDNVLSPVGPTATWIGGTHPSGYTLSAPFVGARTVGVGVYDCILVTVS